MKTSTSKPNTVTSHSLKSKRLERTAVRNKIRGYTNIAKKSREDLIQIIENLKEQNNAKDRAIHFLKVKTEKLDRSSKQLLIILQE